jgi:K+-transporting ATPase ATPase A chain
MLFLLLAGLSVALWSEHSVNPVTGSLSLMEGKETRFGITGSVLWSVSTTAASNGSVNAMMSSLSPLAGMISMINILLGEVIFGGVGSGLYGMIGFIILTVFIAGLMVGRTPEYLGKKIEAFEIQMALAAVLIPGIVILIFTSFSVLLKIGLSSVSVPGPHGFSEILYAFSSAAGNNGSAFAGLNSNTVFYNLSLGCAMILGRFGVIIPMMAIAGSLVRKNITPVSEGTFRTDNQLFVVLLISVILIVGGLTFFPAVAFGPLAEHILMMNGITF